MKFLQVHNRKKSNFNQAKIERHKDYIEQILEEYTQALAEMVKVGLSFVVGIIIYCYDSIMRIHRN
jgi:hypothetical protein